MMQYFFVPLAIALCFLLTGCEKPSGTSAAATNATAAASPQKPAPPPSLNPAELSPPEVAPSATPAETVSIPSAAAVTQLTNTLIASTSVQADAILGGITTDLSKAVGAFVNAVPGHPIALTNMANLLNALSRVELSSALESLRSLNDPRLTPEQRRLGKGVYDATSAFAVQKAFGETPGAGNEIAQIVHVMRQGDQATGLQALLRVANKIQLTPEQNRLLGQLIGPQVPSPPGLPNK